MKTENISYYLSVLLSCCFLCHNTASSPDSLPDLHTVQLPISYLIQLPLSNVFLNATIYTHTHTHIYIRIHIYIFTYLTLSCGDQETLAAKTYWLNKTEYSVRKPNNSPIVEGQKVLYHCSYFLFLTHHGHVSLQ